MFNTEKNRLKKRIQELENDLDIVRASDKHLMTELKNTKDELRDAQKVIETKRKALKKSEKQVIDLTEKLRDQTRADILFNALQAIGVITEKKKETVEPRYQDQALALNNDLASYQSALNAAQSYGARGLGASLFGGFGI